MKKYLVFIILVFIAFSCEKETSADEAFIDEVLTEVNNLRTAGCTCGSDGMPKVSELVWNEQLETAAQRHSDDMAKNSFMNHVGSDGSLFSERITDAGYQWSACAENIASGYSTVAEVIKGWKNSEGHCKNIMNGDYTEIAVARNGNYWTMTLGRK